MPQIIPAQAIARPTYYDRQAEAIVTSFSDGYAPHATTTRATYTVPAGFRAFIESLIGAAQNGSAPSNVGINLVIMTFQPSGGSEANVFYHSHTNTAEQTFSQNTMNTFGYMGAGDAVRLKTVNTDTGGTCTLIGTIKTIEFVA